MSTSSNTKQIPMVSVVMITYGHENYIEEAINGVLMQSCNFDIELIIANDKSPDDTDHIVKRIISEHPKSTCITYTNHQENLGMMKNVIWAFQQANGRYIAFCEGDDYWTDPLKLQKQVDFLIANDDYGLVCTNYTSDEITASFDKSKEIYLKDILKDSAVGTVTTMFKNSLIRPYMSGNLDLQMSMADFPLWIYICSIQKVYKLSDVTAHYRILENSATGRNDVSKRIKFALDVLKIVKENLNKVINRNDRYYILNERYGQLFKVLTEAKDKRFIKYQWEYFKLANAFKIVDVKIFLKGFFKIYLS